MGEILSKNGFFEALGYLSNPQVAMRYDVQVPFKNRVEFERKYKKLTGLKPHGPGYSVLSEGVDKRNVQYRFSYLPEGVVPSYLLQNSKDSPGISKRKRISNKQLLWKMFDHGFALGSPPDRESILKNIPAECVTRFEFGYFAVLSDQKSLEHKKFADAFSSVDSEPKGNFSLYDKRKRDMVYSARMGRSAAFRNHVLNLYEHQCCVCSDSLVDLSGVYETEAAHIVPKRLSGTDDIRNGLALCRKHHWAFDRGMFCIDEKYRVVVPNIILEIAENSSLLYYNDKEISMSSHSSTVPHPSALEWHRKNVMIRH